VRDLAVLVLHLLTTIARLAGPGGTRSVVAESVLLKQQLLILNRTRKRAPNLRPVDRVVAGACALLTRPTRLVRAAVGLEELERNLQRDRDDVLYLARTVPLDLDVLRTRYRLELRPYLGQNVGI
jgi:hypothetical protein